MRFFLSLLFATCTFQLCFAQISQHQLGIGAFYFLSTMSAPLGEETIDNPIVPFGAEIFCTYQFHNRWSLETGFDFRSKRNTFSYFVAPGDAPLGPNNFTTWYLDLPVKLEFHFLGKRNFNFNLLGGLKGTGWYYDEYRDSIQSRGHYHYSDHSFSTALTLGFKESFRISPRIKINAEQLANYYFTGNLKCGGGVDLKLGLEYTFLRKK